MSWKAFELPKAPPILADAVSSFNELVSTSTAILTVLKDLTKTLSALEISSLSVSQTLIKAAVKVIEDNLASLLTDAGVYVLFVPPRKRVEIPEVVKTAMHRVGLTTLPGSQIAPELLTLEGRVEGLRPVLQATGGNNGFSRTVIESLYDPGDANRPKPLATDHIYGLYIMAGATDYLSILSFAKNLKALFGSGRPSVEITSPGLPTPQNVRARQVVDGSSPAALIEWDYQAPVVRKPALDLVVQVQKVAIVRAKSPKVLSASTFTQLFGTAEVTEGLKAGVGDEEVVVVSVQDYGTLAPPKSALDTGPLVKGEGYYYAAGFSLLMGDAVSVAQGQGTAHPFDRLSNWAKVVSRENPSRSVVGTPPDWNRTPSVMALVPDLARTIQLLSAQVAQLSGNASGFGEMLKDQSDHLAEEISVFEETAAQILNRVSRITHLTAGSAGAYVRTVDGQGGLTFLTQDLTTSFSEPGAPPFNAGTEFVAGAVILATAPDAASLAPIKTALDLLFGNAGSAVSAVRQAIAKIDVELRAAEVAQVTVATSSKALVGDDDDGKEDLNCPPVPPDPAFNDDFTPKE
jgi:hypothetical protein